MDHHPPVGPLRAFHPEIAHRDVEPTIDAHPTSVGGMIRSAGMPQPKSDVFQEHLAFIRHPITRRIPKRTQERGMNQIKRVPHKVTAPGTVHTRHKIDKLVRFAITIRVPAGDDFPHPWQLAERSIVVHRDIHRPVARRGERRRVIDLEGLREGVHFESFREGKSQRRAAQGYENRAAIHQLGLPDGGRTRIISPKITHTSQSDPNGGAFLSTKA